MVFKKRKIEKILKKFDFLLKLLHSSSEILLTRLMHRRARAGELASWRRPLLQSKSSFIESHAIIINNLIAFTNSINKGC